MLTKNVCAKYGRRSQKYKTLQIFSKCGKMSICNLHIKCLLPRKTKHPKILFSFERNVNIMPYSFFCILKNYFTIEFIMLCISAMFFCFYVLISWLSTKTRVFSSDLLSKY